MAADWTPDATTLDARGRELVLQRVRGALREAPSSSPLTAVLAALESQLAAGAVRLRLPTGHCDVITLVHLSEVLGSLSTPSGTVRCGHCSGLGTVTLPPFLISLKTEFDAAYNLWQMGGPARQVFLDQAADPVMRAEVAAKRKAELEKQRDADRRAVERSYGVLPGTPRDEAPEERPERAGTPDFMPAGLRGR